jgi:hypothetical protein
MPVSISSENSAERAKRQLALLAVRSREIAERVDAGEIGFIDGVDFCYSAAQWAGLTETAGDNAVQAVLAAGFMGVRRSAAA